MTRLYVAGPMTGYPEWNFPAFETATAELRAAGYDVVSPHELELAYGFDPAAPVEDYSRAALLAALQRDAVAVLASDGVALLPGWTASKGARAEEALAYAAGIRTRSVATWVALAKEETL